MWFSLKSPLKTVSTWRTARCRRCVSRGVLFSDGSYTVKIIITLFREESFIEQFIPSIFKFVTLCPFRETATNTFWRTSTLSSHLHTLRLYMLAPSTPLTEIFRSTCTHAAWGSSMTWLHMADQMMPLCRRVVALGAFEGLFVRMRLEVPPEGVPCIVFFTYKAFVLVVTYFVMPQFNLVIGMDDFRFSEHCRGRCAAVVGGWVAGAGATRCVHSDLCKEKNISWSSIHEMCINTL